jgi:DNA repair photolyase
LKNLKQRPLCPPTDEWSTMTKNKEFKSFLKLPGGGEINRCYYPFKLDTYGCGCSNNCSYCYARSVLHFRRLWDSDNPSVADIGKVEKVFRDVFEKGRKTRHSQLLKDRIPIRLGGMTDCFSDAERKAGVTLKVLKLLKAYDYPYLILTKNKLVAEDDYIEALDPELGYIQFSITTPYDEVAKLYEEGASTSSERLWSMRRLADRGFHVAARLNPLFPIYPDGYFSGNGHYAKKVKPFRYFDWTLIDMLAKAGCKTSIAGFVRLSTWNIRWIREKTGEDLTWLFDPATKQKNTALHFSTEEKRYYYEKIRDLCHQQGMEFSVCYDGDDAYEAFRYLWANPDDCCNGKGKIRGFQKAYDFENPAFFRSGLKTGV